LAWEVSAAIDFALANPKEGYRRLAWMMVDADVACLSESAVYRILSDRDLLRRWARPGRKGGQAPPPATAPNQRWHTDIMHLKLGDGWYFLVSFLDAYSRYIVHWELLPSMTARRVALVQLAALEKHPGTKPQVVSDRGCQYTSREYKQLVRRFELEHILCRVAHPQSNGLIERWHRTTRDALDDRGAPETHPAALRAIEAWVDHYNEQRLHAGLGYIQPAEYYRGDPAGRMTERKRKLAEARQNRRRENRAAQAATKDHGTELEQAEHPYEVSLSGNIAWSHLS
jgi:transposase InsO family protein